ncbi:hypothetical protein LTR62_004359 [Meristemomyces frigidus]|uniref:Uncharacterized protein n=1 Tax=Meristemomyces frigidus TaxID=1508187 RepID=A0AAN7YRF8_9PEZI|nr:hypothetical protein LTR62_004359 [Meristemomyces frigidus]
MADTSKDSVSAIATETPDTVMDNTSGPGASAANTDSTANPVPETESNEAMTNIPASIDETSNGVESAVDEIKAADVAAKDVKDATNPDSVTAEEKVVDKEMKDADQDQDDANGKEDARTGHKRKADKYDRQDSYKQRRGGGFGKGSKVKTRFEDQPESNDAAEIRHQVEFYFSDSNLPIDQYLLNETGGNSNRPVPLKVIHNFKRMRHFQPYQAVRDAVAASTFLVLDEKDDITRKVPLNEKFTSDATTNRTLVNTTSMARSIYAKGFGDETKTTHLDIEAFFEPYGPVNAVRLRRHDDGEFKGSVFVEFADEETKKQFMDLEVKPKWGKGDGVELNIMEKQAYVDLKHDGILDGSVKPKGVSGRPKYRERRERGGGDRSDTGRDHADDDDWKGRREHDQRQDRGGRGRGRGGRGDSGRGRGRGGRGRGRGNFDRNRRDNERDGRSNDGGDRAQKRPTDDAEAGAEKNGNGESKKRSRDHNDEGGAEREDGGAKKAKEEVAA